MQVSPCGHQALCRLCFVHNIQEAVANRDLPLKCLLCGSKIIRVKNNSKPGQGAEHPVHVGIGSRVKRMPKSVSGYSLCATSENEEMLQHKRHSSIAQSQSSYSMSSGNCICIQDLREHHLLSMGYIATTSDGERKVNLSGAF